VCDVKCQRSVVVGEHESPYKGVSVPNLPGTPSAVTSSHISFVHSFIHSFVRSFLLHSFIRSVAFDRRSNLVSNPISRRHGRAAVRVGWRAQSTASRTSIDFRFFSFVAFSIVRSLSICLINRLQYICVGGWRAADDGRCDQSGQSFDVVSRVLCLFLNLSFRALPSSLAQCWAHEPESRPACLQLLANVQV
jgi:hypothetical protein